MLVSAAHFTSFGEMAMERFHLAVVAAVAVVLMSSTSHAQRGYSRILDRLGAAGLLVFEAVQDELKLTDEQRQRFTELHEEARNLGYQSDKKEEYERKLQELATKEEKTIKSTLNDKQKKRLEELYLQYKGPRALLREEVATKLGLDEAQRHKIKKIQDESRQIPQFDYRDATPEQRQKRVRDLVDRYEKASEDMLAVLRPAQKEAFEKMQGESFEFSRPGGSR